ILPKTTLFTGSIPDRWKFRGKSKYCHLQLTVEPQRIPSTYQLISIPANEESFHYLRVHHSEVLLLPMSPPLRGTAWKSLLDELSNESEPVNVVVAVAILSARGMLKGQLKGVLISPFLITKARPKPGLPSKCLLMILLIFSRHNNPTLLITSPLPPQQPHFSVSHLSPTSQTSPESSKGQPSPVSTTSIPTPPPPTPPPPPPITQQHHTNLFENPKQWVLYNPFENHATVLPTTITEPTLFTVANNYTEWRQAIKEEYDALMKNRTWSLVPRASNTNVVDGNNKGTIDNIICQLGSAFALKDLGPLNYFLGIEIVSHVLSQKNYILELLQSAGLSNCNPVSSPMVTSSLLCLDDSTAFSNPVKYRQNHWFEVKRILRYLHGMVEHEEEILSDFDLRETTYTCFKELWDRASSCWQKILVHDSRLVLMVAQNAINQALVAIAMELNTSSSSKKDDDYKVRGEVGGAVKLLGVKVAKRVVLVRHGQSTYNTKGRIQGSFDFSILTNKGEPQSETSIQMLTDESLDH
ncbi:nucleotide-binding alpha-beta plait domain-containing protein, partial [Tanacetum coccineum]